MTYTDDDVQRLVREVDGLRKSGYLETTEYWQDALASALKPFGPVLDKELIESAAKAIESAWIDHTTARMIPFHIRNHLAVAAIAAYRKHTGEST